MASAALPFDPNRFTSAAIDRESVRRRGFHEFIKLAWPVIESTPFIDGWHIQIIAAHLEAVSRGELDLLIITIPPGCSKSSVVSVLWPAWDWIAHPGRKWMASTFDDDLAWRDSMRCRRLIQSDWYRERWGESVAVDEGPNAQNTQTVWSTTKGGRRFSLTVAGKGTGWHGDIQLVDDPTKPKDVRGTPDQARDALEKTWRWWGDTMASRRAGPRLARVIIMQRLAESDLVGRTLENDTDGEWCHVNLPMRFEPKRRCATKWGADPRTVAGELLCPARFDEKAVRELERSMGSQVAAAQLQQRPAPQGGNVFKREWFRVRWMRAVNPKWKHIPTEERDRYVVLPTGMNEALSADCTFKDSASADFVALHAWGVSGSKFYLVDRIHDRMGLPDTVRCLQALALRRPRARARLIEDKANGPAVEQMLRDKMPGIIMVTPEGGKVARANAVSPLCEAGDVILPDESECAWVGEVVEEIVTFPFARNDDDVDAMTQALTYLSGRSVDRYLDAMKKAKERMATGRMWS